MLENRKIKALGIVIANFVSAHQQTCILVLKFLVFSCVSVFPETQKHGNMENMLQLH